MYSIPTNYYLNITILSSLLALVYALYMTKRILSFDCGTNQMIKIATSIQEGAKAYLNRQYKTIFLVGLLMAILLGYFISSLVAVGFLIGSVLSGFAGYVGMYVSVRANVRTTECARSFGLNKALDVAFKSGTITGFLVVGLALLGIVLYYKLLIILNIPIKALLESLVALSFGSSLISIFARLGGGIFTKGADIGADLVGKIEAGIPEDDPRNPAVIADNVGDNVGDCAGMAADLFETYVVTLVASMLLSVSFFPESEYEKIISFPLLISGLCIIGTIFGVFFVKLGNDQNVSKALYRSLISSGFICAGLIICAIFLMFGFDHKIYISNMIITPINIIVCSIVGLMVTCLIVVITEYYTSSSYNPVKSIAKSSLTGHATNIIQGIAISMESTALPVLVICFAIAISYINAGLWGISISAVTMLALSSLIISLDAYGPVTDNAGGIAEMSNLPESVRSITDLLDAVGNTTKAITKGYAIGSAGLASLVLFTAYTEDLKYYFPDLEVKFSLLNPFVLIGLLVGGLLPYLFGSFGMKAVGNAGAAVVMEVRRQFKEIKGIMSGSVSPDYGRAVDLLTKAAIKEMIIPSLLPVLTPILLYFIVYLMVGREQAFEALGALLIGTIITGLFIAISMTSGGGAWDNAKKYIEEGNFGGKFSEAHKAAITGDTVGDPYKDTVGPAINPMIKIVNIVAILLLQVIR